MRYNVSIYATTLTKAMLKLVEALNSTTVSFKEFSKYCEQHPTER